MYIICVEDNPTDLEYATHVLRQAGHEVITFSKATDALLCAQQRSPDALLTDFRLERSASGLSLASSVRKLFPRCVILLMSSHMTLDMAVDAMHSGLDDILPKPLDALDLDKRLWDAVIRRQEWLPVSDTGDFCNSPRKGKFEKLFRSIPGNFRDCRTYK